MKRYEGMFIIRPDLTGEETDQVLSQIEDELGKLAGKVIHREMIGRKALAYPIQKQNEGIYVLYLLDLASAEVKRFERRLKMNQKIVRFMLIRVDEEVSTIESFGVMAEERERAAEASSIAPKAAEESASKEAPPAAVPAVEEATAAEDAPVVEEAPAVAEAPVTEEAPAGETPAAEEGSAEESAAEESAVEESAVEEASGEEDAVESEESEEEGKPVI